MVFQIGLLTEINYLKFNIEREKAQWVHLLFEHGRRFLKKDEMNIHLKKLTLHFPKPYAFYTITFDEYNAIKSLYLFSLGAVLSFWYFE